MIGVVAKASNRRIFDNNDFVHPFMKLTRTPVTAGRGHDRIAQAVRHIVVILKLPAVGTLQP
ncbi:hypothetical protein D3C76_1544940 [compost metagenome]